MEIWANAIRYEEYGLAALVFKKAYEINPVAPEVQSVADFLRITPKDAKKVQKIKSLIENFRRSEDD